MMNWRKAQTVVLQRNEISRYTRCVDRSCEVDLGDGRYGVLWQIEDFATIIQRRDTMATAKEHISEIIRRQPDNSTYDDIVRELAFDLMVQRGLKDSDARRTIPNGEMERRIKTWQK